MKNISIADMTLCRKATSLSFKEKIEIVRQLEKLNVDAVELPAIESKKTDVLLIRTISSFVKNSIISVAAGMSIEGVELAAEALSATAKPRIRIELPMSPVGMEYTCRKKPAKMIEFIGELCAKAKELCQDVEFCALDATRAEEQFLVEALKVAVSNGVNTITICDSAAEMMPDEFANFVSGLKLSIPELESIEFGVCCENKNNMANAAAILSVRSCTDLVKTSVSSSSVSLEAFAEIIKNCGVSYRISSNIKYTELNRIIRQISRITGDDKSADVQTVEMHIDDSAIFLDKSDDISAVGAVAQKLGYDLSEEDSEKVYEEFKKLAEKKDRVGAKELDAIVAAVALQVPPTYKLVSYVINTGNIISASAQIKVLKSDGTEIEGVSMGDGPIDAAFRAIEQITGSHYELDDFQIQSVTEGREAMGSAVIRLREGGRLYSGSGISTDIIGASISAYLGAVNKIVYEGV
jgi:2-isopropylmalate synthase